jgi:hypothetical protein
MLNDGSQLIILQSIIGRLSEGDSEIYEAVSKTIGWLDPTIIATFSPESLLTSLLRGNDKNVVLC